jgi:hypothetical protein
MDMLQRDSSFVFAVARNQQTEVRRQHPHTKLNAYRPVLIPSTEHTRGPADRRARVIESAEGPAAWSGDESIDREPDRHPSGHCQRSEDDKESSQLATRRGLDLGRGLLFTCSGKSIAESGFCFDKSLSEDQERLHMSIVNFDQDAGAQLFQGVTPTASL